MQKTCLGLLLVWFCQITAVCKADDSAEAQMFVMGNLEFVLLHEFSHVVIGDNSLPVLGPLESAADYLAISLAIRGDERTEVDTFLTQALLDSAAAFARAWHQKQSGASRVPYWDIHGLSIQRYYNILCLIYGSNPSSHNALLAEIPDSRAMSCPGEHALASRSLDWLLKEYGASQHPNVGANEILVEYQAVRSVQQKQRMKHIRDVRLAEKTANSIASIFRLDGAVTVRFDSCRRPEAAWNAQERVLLVCYEMIDALYALY